MIYIAKRRSISCVFRHVSNFLVLPHLPPPCCLQATGDPYYLEVGRTVLDNLNRYARVPCGFAAMKDVRTGSHEDR